MDVTSKLASIIGGSLLSEFRKLAELYVTKQISKDEFDSRVKIAASDSEARVATAWADTLKSATESIHATIRSSIVIQRAYVAVLFLQTLVLIWYQVGAPAFEVITGRPWPQPGVALEWAYAIVVGMVAGPLLFKRMLN